MVLHVVDRPGQLRNRCQRRRCRDPPGSGGCRTAADPSHHSGRRRCGRPAVRHEQPEPHVGGRRGTGRERERRRDIGRRAGCRSVRRGQRERGLVLRRHRVGRAVVPRAVDGGHPQRRRVRAERLERHGAEPAGAAVGVPHRDGDRVAAVRLQDPVRDREEMLRAHVVDVAAELPAVHEDERPVVPARTVCDPEADRGVLPLRQVEGDRGAVPRDTRRGVGRRQGDALPRVVGIARQRPAGPLTEQPTGVHRPANRVDEVLAAAAALDAPGERRQRRAGDQRAGEPARLLVRVVGVVVLVVPHVLDKHRDLVVGADVDRAGRERERVRAVAAAAEEGAVQPGRVHPGAPGECRERDTGRGGVRAEPAAVPDVAVVETVVVCEQHGQRARRGVLFDVILSATCHRRVVEAGLGLG